MNNEPKLTAVAAIGTLWAAGAVAEGLTGSDAMLNQSSPQEEVIAASPLPRT